VSKKIEYAQNDRAFCAYALLILTEKRFIYRPAVFILPLDRKRLASSDLDQSRKIASQKHAAP